MTSESPIRPLDGTEYEPSVSAERIGWAMSDLAMGLAEFAKAMESTAIKLREVLRENEEMLGAKPVPD